MKDRIKKWWNREWGNWEHVQNVTYRDGEIWYIVLKRTSDDGLMQLKEVRV
jgi:hypothetical protein